MISWAGMRGVVSLAIAFSIPVTAEGEDFPHRYLLLFLTFTTVIGTLVVQGLTLPPLIRLLRLPGRDPQAETLAEANAQAQASRVAEERLDELLADERNALPRRWPTGCAASWSAAATPSGSGSGRPTPSPGSRWTTPTGGCPGR